MSDIRLMSREFLTEFILLYREHPCLWKIKSKEYIDRNKKAEAYKILVRKLQNIQPNATKNDVVNKINTLRGGFRREYKKVHMSKKSGSGADDIFVPTLWYYDLLLFVRDQDIPQKSISNVSDESNHEEEYSEKEDGENLVASEKEESIHIQGVWQ
ncbi:Alcohol dehydrogenase transcription factor Myb/SANT-like [Popillia japonica]|uniref:Alcohol dehydrogenase transcription factor Myb/SANT-like n=1 Tax=Popillia japonica TaxID=7064 RepID=A0AAW1I9R0_POPJA